MAVLASPMQRFFGSHGGFATSTTLEIFRDSTLFTFTSSGSGWETVATYSITNDMLANSIYKTNVVLITFNYWGTGTLSNDFRLTLDGTTIRTWPSHTNDADTTYSTVCRMANGRNHTITVDVSNTNGATNNVNDFIITATVEVI